MKWILLLIAVICVWYYLNTGTLGGASKATQNYQDVLLGNKYSKDNLNQSDSRLDKGE